MKTKEEKKLEKEIKEEHNKNILHKFCREIDSLVSEGKPVKDSYYFVKNKYQVMYNCRGEHGESKK